MLSLWMPQVLKNINIDKWGFGGGIPEFSGCYSSSLHKNVGAYGVKAIWTFDEFLY